MQIPRDVCGNCAATLFLPQSTGLSGVLIQTLRFKQYSTVVTHSDPTQPTLFRQLSSLKSSLLLFSAEVIEL
jgi:hypothetical protein